MTRDRQEKNRNMPKDPKGLLVAGRKVGKLAIRWDLKNPDETTTQKLALEKNQLVAKKLIW
jgi:hypothetical protein